MVWRICGRALLIVLLAGGATVVFIASLGGGPQGGGPLGQSYLCQLIQAPALCKQMNWLQVVAWVAGILGGLVGLVALRQRVHQARATFLLSLDDHWSQIADARNDHYVALGAIKERILAKHSKYSDERRQEAVVEACAKFFEELRKSTKKQDQRRYKRFLQYLGFFETVGVMVRRGYVPLFDMVEMYKGPILDVDTFFRNHIKDLQARANVPPGLYENAFYLVTWTRRHEQWRIVRWLGL